MIVPFLEFDIFWEKFVNTLAAQIALLQENDPFTKKNDQKDLMKLEKKSDFFSQLTEN